MSVTGGGSISARRATAGRSLAARDTQPPPNRDATVPAVPRPLHPAAVRARSGGRGSEDSAVLPAVPIRGEAAAVVRWRRGLGWGPALMHVGRDTRLGQHCRDAVGGQKARLSDALPLCLFSTLGLLQV